MKTILNILSVTALINIALFLFVVLSVANGASGDDMLSQFIKWEVNTVIN
jgi:hypothetical protein